ncbi:hypothetical protein [Vibrio cholerae]|uniref:hypothetical protein n=1 Tax=Vibrio cholerae TaxID=666 RepID=UPI000E68F439|nr:hypothetical protein [Vibrio cholerae]
MDFERASDQELNVKLTELELTKRYPKAKSIDFDGTKNCFWVHDTGFSSFKVEEYCTDISATWPLMIEHGISIQSPSLCGSIDEWTAKYWESDDENFINLVGHDKDPLRAVVVCLIKVLENKHERT